MILENKTHGGEPNWPDYSNGVGLTLRGHEQVDIFNDIKEEFIPPILYALPSPANLSCDLSSNKGV